MQTMQVLNSKLGAILLKAVKHQGPAGRQGLFTLYPVHHWNFCLMTIKLRVYNSGVLCS